MANVETCVHEDVSGLRTEIKGLSTAIARDREERIRGDHVTEKEALSERATTEKRLLWIVAGVVFLTAAGGSTVGATILKVVLGGIAP